MLGDHQGEVYAFLAALTWATALVLFKRSGETIGPLSLSMFKNVVACVLLGTTLIVLAAIGVDGGGEGPGQIRLRDLSAYEVFVLLASGTIGIAIADTILFVALELIGVGLVTVAECSYTPFVMFMAWLMLGERIGTADLIGAGMVLSGVLLSSTHAPPANRTRTQLLVGSLLGVTAIGMMAFGIVWAKPILEKTPLLPTTMLRLVGGTVVLCVILAISRKRAVRYAVFRPSRGWRTLVPASILGTYFAMIFWVGGFKYTDASTAAVLNQTSTIIALILAAIILKEPLTRRKMGAAALAFSGVVVVTMLGPGRDKETPATVSTSHAEGASHELSD